MNLIAQSPWGYMIQKYTQVVKHFDCLDYTLILSHLWIFLTEKEDFDLACMHQTLLQVLIILRDKNVYFFALEKLTM